MARGSSQGSSDYLSSRLPEVDRVRNVLRGNRLIESTHHQPDGVESHGLHLSRAEALHLLGAAAVVDDDPARFGLAAVGAASVAVVLELVWRRWPDQIGLGDVRLIIVNSLLAGWWGPSWSWWALMAGAVAEWPVAAVSLARRGRAAKVRWAPGLVTGTAAVVAYNLWFAG